MDLGTAVGYLMLDASGFQKGFSQAQGYLKTFQSQTATFSDKMSALGNTMSSIGGTLTTSVTLPLVGLGTAALKVGNDFEAQMSRVQAISGATGEELQSLNDLALQLGADTSFSASQAAQGMENLASAGFTVNEIVAAMPGLLDLAASSGADLATATEIAASAVRGFGLEADQTGHVADVFAEASARTNAQVEDMGEAMKYIAPVANAMGQSLEETAAAIGIMSDAGIKGSQAGTSLRGALSRLAKPTEAMLGVMDQLGISFFDAEGNMLSLSGIVSQLETNMAGLTQEQRNNALVTLFGQESLSGMLALMDRGSDELSAMAESFEDVDGAAKAMADVMLDNTAGALEALGGSIETLAIKLQQVMAPTVQAIAEKLTEFINTLSSMDEGTLRVIVTVGSLVAAIGPLLLIIGKVVSAISAIGPALSVLTGPIGIIIAAVAALAVAWATDFAGIRETTESIFNSIREIIESIWNTITEIWDSNFLGIRSIAETTWAAIKGIFEGAFQAIEGVFEVFSALFRGDWEALWQGIKDIFSGIWTAIGSLLEGFLNAIVLAITGIGKTLWDAATEAFNNIKEGFENVWAEITNWFESVIEDPVGTVKSIGTALWNAGAEIFNELWNGLKSVWDSITSWVENAVNWIVEKVAFWKSEASQINNSSVGGGGSPGTGGGGRHAAGLDYVPYTGYRAVLEEGERVLTRQEAQNYGKTRAATFIIQNTFTQPVTESLASKVSKKMARDVELELRNKGVVLA